MIKIEVGKHYIVAREMDDNFILLEPCPFCGQEAALENHGDNGWFCGCVNESCDFQPS